MRRIAMMVTAAITLVAVAAGPAEAGTTLTRITGPLPHGQDVTIRGACLDPVVWHDRGGRTLTTVAKGRDIVMQRITGTSRVVLTNGRSGLELIFDIEETTTIVYDPRRGSATSVQVGSSGLIYDPDPIPGAGSFTWYGGMAVTSGRIDPNTLLYADVERQRHSGLEGDVCDMLVSGLKTRH